MIKEFSKLLGQTIKNIREEKNINQLQFLKRIGIRSHRPIPLIEAGRCCPRISTMWRIARALGIKPSEIVIILEKQLHIKLGIRYDDKSKPIIKEAMQSRIRFRKEKAGGVQ